MKKLKTYHSLRGYHSLMEKFWPAAKNIRRSDYAVVSKIRARAKALQPLSGEQFLETANDLRQRLSSGLDVLDTKAVVESFALTTESLRRATGKVYYDCQLLGGLVLATGSIAEMHTGEGKTVTCALPSVLYGFTGAGVHVATTNAYLAERDHEELIPIFELLGISSGIIKSDQDIRSKQKAYASDVTYGTGYEFGFDFLRDQLALRNRPRLPLGTRYLGRLRGMDTGKVSLMQRALAFAVIDEADSVLIDEATTPLILSGSGGKSIPNRDVYENAMDVADGLQEDRDFLIDDVKNIVELTEAGWQLAHAQLSVEVQSFIQRPWAQYIEQSLRAKLFMHCDVDYVVQDEQVVIVDQNTGRVHDERKWRSGLHQSVEIREGVPLTEEREIEARITRQRYFKFYDRVAGMTGTATGNEPELLEFYQLPVIQIPRNKPSRRIHLPARYFATVDAKYAAIVDDVDLKSETGQPILIGTKTITQSRELSRMLAEDGIEHSVLNGTQDDDEAAIISRAGIAGAVTIATNMAGRGTDIRLDDEAHEAGGLHVIVAEHHESPRVDRQLIGRAARQSDPGSCQFFVSADDEIIVRYDKTLRKTLQRTADTNGECQANYDRNIQELQAKIERLNFASRQKMVLHDRWTESVQKAVAKLA